jgi:hypothetical protein
VWPKEAGARRRTEDKGDGSVTNDVSRLSVAMEAIKFPWSISTKDRHLIIDRGP